MGLENSADITRDFAEDITENIQDAMVEIGEFSKDAIESLGDKGMEALEKGDLGEAIEYSDMPKESKELAKDIVENFKINMPSLISSSAKIAAGTLGAVAALATPGFQPAGLTAGALAMKGIQELASQF